MISPRELAHILGGDVTGTNSVHAPAPGHSPKDRSLHVTLSPTAPDGFVVSTFARDDWQTARDHVRSRLGLPRWGQVSRRDRIAVDHEAERRDRDKEEAERIASARWIWLEAADPRGTLAEVYLKSRGLVLPDNLASRVLRFHPRCPWRNEDTGKTDRVPALLAAFRSIDDDSFKAIHRVALTADGQKLGRMMLGPVKRSAIKLDPIGNGELYIGEGVETCLAARTLDHRPAWAVGSAGMITQLPLIDGVETLHILGENDASSEQAIEICGERWRRAGRKVCAWFPQRGKDFNDELMEQARASG